MSVRILIGDCRDVLRTLPDESVHCVVTSPPYWGLRDYGVSGQIGLETSYGEFVARIVGVFSEIRRVLRSDGTAWLNLGDSYCSTDKWGGGGNAGKHTVAEDGNVPSRAVRERKPHQIGIKPKDLVGIPWRVAFALQVDGWWLRQDIIWSKPNPMPESVTDRCTKAHEYLFLLSKSERYYYDADAIAEAATNRDPGNLTHKMQSAEGIVLGRKTEPNGGLMKVGPAETRNRRSVWTVTTQPFSEAHFATFPPALIEPCILAGCPEGGTVLDPFGGAGTSGLVADRLGRNAILIELNPTYAEMAERRIRGDAALFTQVATERVSVLSASTDTGG